MENYLLHRGKTPNVFLHVITALAAVMSRMNINHDDLISSMWLEHAVPEELNFSQSIN